jgi:hypothetical protein
LRKCQPGVSNFDQVCYAKASKKRVGLIFEQLKLPPEQSPRIFKDKRYSDKERPMRDSILLVLSLVLLGAAGCRSNDPAPSPGGVSVNAPGVHVNVNDNQGVNVNAPGTNVHVQP